MKAEKTVPVLKAGARCGPRPGKGESMKGTSILIISAGAAEMQLLGGSGGRALPVCGFSIDRVCEPCVKRR